MRRLLYLVDIAVIALVYLALDAGTNAIPLPDDFRIGIVVSTFAKCVCIVFIWFWLRLRGDSVAAIGLKQPHNWLRSILLGMAVAAVLVTAVFLLERAGARRDLSVFEPYTGDLDLTRYQLGVVVN